MYIYIYMSQIIIFLTVMHSNHWHHGWHLLGRGPEVGIWRICWAPRRCSGPGASIGWEEKKRLQLWSPFLDGIFFYIISKWLYFSKVVSLNGEFGIMKHEILGCQIVRQQQELESILCQKQSCEDRYEFYKSSTRFAFRLTFCRNIQNTIPNQ